MYSVLQTKKAIEKEGGRVNKCVHPDTTVILANWILLAARSATKEMIFWYLLKLHLDGFQVCKSDSQKLSRRKHFCRTKNTGRDSKRYDVDIPYIMKYLQYNIYIYTYIYIYIYRYLYCIVHIYIYLVNM